MRWTVTVHGERPLYDNTPWVRQRALDVEQPDGTRAASPAPGASSSVPGTPSASASPPNAMSRTVVTALLLDLPQGTG
ncbi:hypothetical protein AB0942_16035 [Streptomyces nodosus]|uniref:hypothetical protein n=1 Tax=Streptomyces nodosus TaxID=40318 RepID=UPI003454160A